MSDRKTDVAEFIGECNAGIMSDKPQICLRIIKLEAQEEDMAEEFKELLVGMFADSQLKTFIGQS